MHNSDDDLHEQSWENFQPDPSEPVPTQKMREHIEGHVGRPPVRTIAYRWVAAASVILLAAAGLRFWKTTEKPPVATVNTQKTQPPATAARRIITNNTSAVQLFFLPDGSKVRLSKGSSISFDSGRDARRDIALTGQAVFTVAPDKTRPFTVHSIDLAVTALGTVFGVDDTHSAFTTVLLYSGKVVVKKAATGARGFSDVYLTPGQQLTVDRNDLSVSIRMALPPQSAAAEKTPAVKQLMTFTRQPLTEIFNELHNTYHITINYDAAAVKNMDFTGTFNSEKESLESFLSTLCDLNELTLKKTKDKGFSIQPR